MSMHKSLMGRGEKTLKEYVETVKKEEGDTTIVLRSAQEQAFDKWWENYTKHWFNCGHLKGFFRDCWDAATHSK